MNLSKEEHTRIQTERAKRKADAESRAVILKQLNAQPAEPAMLRPENHNYRYTHPFDTDPYKPKDYGPGRHPVVAAVDDHLLPYLCMYAGGIGLAIGLGWVIDTFQDYWLFQTTAGVLFPGILITLILCVITDWRNARE